MVLADWPHSTCAKQQGAAKDYTPHQLYAGMHMRSPGHTGTLAQPATPIPALNSQHSIITTYKCNLDWGCRKPVWREAHGHDCCHIQVCCFIHNAFSHHSTALIDHWEEDELNDFLISHLGGLATKHLC